MAGDQQPVAPTRALGDDADDDDRRQAILDEPAQQAVLALGEVVGELLDDVRRAVAVVAELDEADDVAVQAEHAVHVRQVPVLEVDGERQRPELRMVGGIGELQPHADSLASTPNLGAIRIRAQIVSDSETERAQRRFAPRLGRSAGRCFDLVPEGVEGGEVGGAQVDAALGGERLDRLEAAAELAGRRAHGDLGVDVERGGRR